jgi:probable DNA metabolism protein
MLLIYDNTYKGFLSAVFAAFATKGQDVVICKEKNVSQQVLFAMQYVETDIDRAGRVEVGMRRLSAYLPGRIYKAWLYGGEGIDNDILAVLRLGFDNGTNPLWQQYHSSVRKVELAARKVGNEVQRYLQFVRFVEFGSPMPIMVADIEPQYDIIQAIGEHFHSRFAEQRFIIRDLVHGKAIISDKDGWGIIELDEKMSQMAFPTEDEFTSMWQDYFKVMANPQRKNLKLQQKFVPLRYRKHLTEFQK